MKREIKKLWCDALRSGEYRQITDIFADGRGGYCAIGLLGKLFLEYKCINPSGFQEQLLIVDYVRPLFSTPAALEWAGIKKYNDILTIARLNNSGMSFPDIAAWIEEHIPDEDTPQEPAPISMKQLEYLEASAQLAADALELV